jgi:hypothetical protein
MSMGAGLIVSGGIAMDRLVPSLGGLAGGEVENHTGPLHPTSSLLFESS